MRASAEIGGDQRKHLPIAAWSSLRRWLYDHTVLVITILFVIVVLATVAHVYYLQRQLVESGARQGAQLQSETLAALRAYYTSEVVERVRTHGIEVTHDYQQTEGAIPLPATFTIGLSERISLTGSGQQVRLYSDFPFPGRRSRLASDAFA